QNPPRRRTPHVRPRARDRRHPEFVRNEAEDFTVPAVVAHRIRDRHSEERDPERAHGELDALVLHGVANREATGKPLDRRASPPVQAAMRIPGPSGGGDPSTSCGVQAHRARPTPPPAWLRRSQTPTTGNPRPRLQGGRAGTCAYRTR